MPRKAASSLRVDPNVRVVRIYPTEQTKKSVKNLQTIGIKLSRDQSIHLARVLLAMSQDFDFLDITAYRFESRKSDKTYRMTVTGVV